MDGFPKTLQQVTLLKSIKIKPSKVILLECGEEASVKRLQER
jgi:adenylate kinase family enzyme